MRRDSLWAIALLAPILHFSLSPHLMLYDFAAPLAKDPLYFLKDLCWASALANRMQWGIPWWFSG